MRYDKGSDFGFEATWHKAHHLVTTAKQYPTEPYNFNFIFASDACRESQWEGLYDFVPALLIHTWQVAKTLIAQFAPDFHPENPVNELRRLAGFMLATHDNSDGDADYRVGDFMHDFFDELKCPCPSCGSVLSVPTSRDAVQAFYRDGGIQCLACGVCLDLACNVEEEEDGGLSEEEGVVQAAFQAWADAAGLAADDQTDVVYSAFRAGFNAQVEVSGASPTADET